MSLPSAEPGLWAIVLAGGDGERLCPFVTRWLGRPVPKQYCAFVGSRSLFQRTVDRCDGLVEPQRRVSVVARQHREEARAQWGDRDPGLTLEQPRNRGTAAGLFLALAQVRAREPDATVVVFPSDQFVDPEDRFAGHVLRACRAADELEDRVIVLGAQPRGAEPGYGWVVPGPSLLHEAGVSSVRAFLEKPGQSATRWALESAGLWSTMVLVGRAETLWQLGRDHAPDVAGPFERLAQAIGSPAEAPVLQSIYEQLPSCDLSAHLLERAPERLAVAGLAGVDWSDWGTVPRIAASLRRLGREPAFPPEMLRGVAEDVLPAERSTGARASAQPPSLPGDG